MKRNCCFAFTTLSFTAQHLRTSIIWHFSMHCIHCELPNVKCQMWAHQCEIWNMGSPMWNFKCELTNVKWSLSSLNSQLKLILPPAISSTWIIMEIPMMILSKKILIKAMVIRLRTMLIKMMKLSIWWRRTWSWSPLSLQQQPCRPPSSRRTLLIASLLIIFLSLFG